MVAHHSTTEEEQLNELKSFLKKTWKLILAVLIIGLVTVWGWKYWQSHTHQGLEEASNKYDNLLTKLDSKNLDSVKELVAFSESEHNTYSVLAAFEAAKFYVDNAKDYAAAQAVLESAITKTKDEVILDTLYTRIARLQYQQALFEDSLQTLDKVKSEGWAAIVNDIRGDIYVKLARYNEAGQAYNMALASQPAPALETNIQMKLNQTHYLIAKQDGATTETKAAQATSVTKANDDKVTTQNDAQ
jgi:predicted negative regulator of RcsB-dependent stress response